MSSSSKLNPPVLKIELRIRIVVMQSRMALHRLSLTGGTHVTFS